MVWLRSDIRCFEIHAISMQAHPYFKSIFRKAYWYTPDGKVYIERPQTHKQFRYTMDY